MGIKFENDSSIKSINTNEEPIRSKRYYEQLEQFNNFICMAPRYNDNYIDSHNIAYIQDKGKEKQGKKDLIKDICDIAYCNTDLTKLSIEQLKEIKEKVYEELYKVVNNKTEI